MNLIEEILAEKDQYLERFHFAAERVQSIYEETSLEDCSVSVHGIAFADYFHTVASFLLQILDFYHKKSSGELCDYSLDELKKLNMSLYQDVLPEEYENSFANPAFAAEKLGKEFGQVLCTLYTELRSNIVYAFEDRLFYLATTFELFIEVYNIIEQPDSDAEEAKSAIYYYFFDYADITAADSLHDSFDPARNFATDIICNCDLTDLRYPYYYGE